MTKYFGGSRPARRIGVGLVAAFGALAMSSAAAAGVASADPGMGAAVNTTCSYPQVVAAMNAQDPEAAAKFNASPMAQSWLQKFLAAPPAQREHMVQRAEAMQGSQKYMGLVTQVLGTCNNY